MNPSEKRLAVAVEDHLLEYFDFEGIIPDGQYGAGPVVIWDSGTYELKEQKTDKISFVLDGGKLKGGFTLARLKGRGKGDQWLLIKKKDEHAVSEWKLEKSLTPQKRASLKKRIPPCETS
jgi:bifunctional non-homologous end joining protein LigD